MLGERRGLLANIKTALEHRLVLAGNMVNPLSPHDALKHTFTALKTDLIFLQPRNWFTNTWQFSLIFHPHQIIFIHYKS